MKEEFNFEELLVKKQFRLDYNYRSEFKLADKTLVASVFESLDIEDIDSYEPYSEII